MAHILWEGPSMLDGSSIQLIASGIDRWSTNRKTGPMVQTFILRKDISPIDAIKCGADFSICGNCIHRQAPRTCYVNAGRGPQAAWKSAKDFTKTMKASEAGRGRRIRVGTYGDPAAVPFEVWQTLLKHSAGHTGYTHQWRTCDPRFRSIVAASVESYDEWCEAKDKGWQTFRVMPHKDDYLASERPCPASEEEGHKATCYDGLRCGGKGKDVAVVVHGTTKKHFPIKMETRNHV